MPWMKEATLLVSELRQEWTEEQIRKAMVKMERAAANAADFVAVEETEDSGVLAKFGRRAHY